MPDLSSIKSLNKKEKAELEVLLAEYIRRQRMKKFFTYYPEEGPLSRHAYPKHISFMDAGATYRERCTMKANRVGGTEGIGCYELTCHLTGKYPDWWKGRRFKQPIRAWAAGTTAETTRDILQRKLLGPLNDQGTGMIPGRDIVDPKRDAGIPDAIGTVSVKHYSGKDPNGNWVEDGLSSLSFKAYKAGRKSFEGDEQDVILLDEEPDLGIYTECLMRTMTTNGLVMLIFTPLEGLSEVVMQFMPGGQVPEPGTNGRFMVGITWDDAPHLTEQAKTDLWRAIPPHLRDARAKGIPAIGSGAIYPISEADLLIDDFPMPDFHPRSYGFDVGWKATAGLWGFWDQEHDILYIYNEYKRGMSEPVVHAAAIQSRGEWIHGVSDPAARIGNQKDGEKLLDEYISLGLHLSLADNAVEAGIFDVWLRMTTGRLKIFRSCVMLLEEFRIYRRDEKGHVVKQSDHLMDCLRYLVRSGKTVAKVMPTSIYMEKMGRDQEDYSPLTFGLQEDYRPLTFGLVV